MIVNLLVLVSIVILTGLVSLLIGNERTGWDGAAWHGKVGNTEA